MGQEVLAGSCPEPDLPLFQNLELQLLAKLQSCFCFLTEVRLQRKEEEHHEELDPYAKKLEAPFIGGADVD